METNKLTLEDNFLSLEQAKELKELGVDFSGANFGIYNFYDSLPECEVTEIRKLCKPLQEKLVTETLSVVEMLEMLPEIIKVKDVLYELYLKKSSFYIVGYREYLNESLSINEFIYTLIRDALFEMLKWLKQNKLI